MNEIPSTKSTAASEVEAIDVAAVNSKANRELYAARQKIHPKAVAGTFRRFKWLVMAVTLGIYYLTPWIRWDRGPGLPDQAVLLDMANRRFYFFFVEIWPQEFFYVAGMLVMAGIGLFLVTSVLGRAWCGYTCPQTVWVDLFLVVERFFEGDRNARIKLDKAPLSFDKIRKRVSKHTIWLLLSIATGGAWIFYFADAPTLFIDLFTGQAAFVAYATVAVLTATTYIFGGLMREQVCTYMCPWPRIQAAMLDEHSLTVTYNDWRGEPRSRHAKRMRAAGELTGDCVDCNACVAACPMGIDIRDGQQLECITCALCIDACDTVMEKIGLEKGLISYATLNDYNTNMLTAGFDSTVAGSKVMPEKVRDQGNQMSESYRHVNLKTFLRPRTLLYAAVYSIIGIAILVHLGLRDRLDVNLLQDRNPLHVVLSDGSIRNGYELKILNMKGEERTFRIRLEGFPQARFRIDDQEAAPDNGIEAVVEADKLRSLRMFVTVPREAIKSAKTDFKIKVSETGGGEQMTIDALFEAPEEAIQ